MPLLALRAGVLACLYFFGPSCAVLLGQSDGIAVTAVGEVRAKPDTLVILTQIAGSGTLSADALVKYRDNRRRVLDAVQATKQPSLKTEWLGLAIYANKQHTRVTSALRISLSGIREMSEETLLETTSRLLDELKDAGVPAEPEVAFLVSNAAALREVAYAQAMSHARTQGELIARLAGVQLGAVLAVGAEDVPLKAALSSYDDDDDEEAEEYWEDEEYVMATQPGLTDDDGETRRVSHWFREIPVRVRLRVRFGMERALVDGAGAAVGPR